MEKEVTMQINQKRANTLGKIALGVLALFVIDYLTSDNEPKKRQKRRSNTTSKKIFISFAYEDITYRGFLVGQSKNPVSPFSFDDMSLQQSLPQDKWKEICRKKIEKSDGMIVLLSNNSKQSKGLRWEVNCAYDIGIPVIGMHINKKNKGVIPPELDGCKITTWSWENLVEELNQI